MNVPGVLRASSRWEARVRVREAVARMLAEEHASLAPGERSPRLVRELSDGIVGLGPG